MGFKIQSLKILPFGYSISFRIDTRNYNKKILKGNLLSIKKIIIAIAGPLVNMILIFIIIYIGEEKILNIETNILVYVNILILTLNLLPIYPLDGGRILKNVSYIFLGKISSLKITNIVANIIAILLTLITIVMSVKLRNISYILVLIYIWIIVVKENKIYKMKIKMYKILKNNIAINQD